MAIRSIGEENKMAAPEPDAVTVREEVFSHGQVIDHGSVAAFEIHNRDHTRLMPNKAVMAGDGGLGDAENVGCVATYCTLALGKRDNRSLHRTVDAYQLWVHGCGF
jgi:hypothetical protein